MNFEFAEQINTDLENLEFGKAISIAETELKKIPTTDFHSVIGQSMISQVDSLVSWVDNYYKSTSKKIDIKALYFEMNEFDINTDTWYIDGFCYNKDGGLDLHDMEWLCDFTRDTMTSEEFIVGGFEKLQLAFENIEPDNDDLQNARDWSEQIVIARFMELMRTTHLKAKEQKLEWATIPLYFTEHSYDFILKSDN